MTPLTKDPHHEVREMHFRGAGREKKEPVYFIARSEPGKQMLMHKGLNLRGIAFDAPMITESRRCGRRGMRTIRRFYAPGYTFVMLKDQGQRDALLLTPGFQSLMRSGHDRYVVLLPAAMDRIARILQSTVKEKADLPFKVGEFVRVVEGPFASFPGQIEEIPHKDRLKVAIGIFGQATPVELDAWQVEQLEKR